MQSFSKWLVVVFSLMALGAPHAAETGKYLTCKNSKINLTLFHTAVVTHKSGTLKLKGISDRVAIKCKKENEPDTMVSSDAIITHYKCEEKRMGEGKYLVRVVSGGLLGMLRAEVSKEQAFPLKPKQLGMVQCKENEEDLTDSHSEGTDVIPSSL